MRILALICALAFATPALAARPRSYRTELLSADRTALAVRTDRALDTMIKLAVWDLRLHGYDEAADQMEGEWRGTWAGFLTRQLELEDIGDYAPLSQWLTDQYTLLAVLVGENVIRFLHLDDLMVINYGLPVVMHLPTITQPIDVTQYGLHFVPFSGVVGYWTSWALCTGLTWGMGAVSFACTQIGDLVEHVTVNYVAPRASPRFWARLYP